MAKQVQSNEEMNFNMKLGQNLQEARLKAKVRQGTLANLIGCTRVHVSHIESGKSRVTVYELKKYAESCDIDVASLIMSGTNETLADSISNSFSKEQLSAIINMLMQSSEIKDKKIELSNNDKLLMSRKQEFRKEISRLKNN